MLSLAHGCYPHKVMQLWSPIQLEKHQTSPYPSIDKAVDLQTASFIYELLEQRAECGYIWSYFLVYMYSIINIFQKVIIIKNGSRLDPSRRVDPFLTLTRNVTYGLYIWRNDFPMVNCTRLFPALRIRKMKFTKAFWDGTGQISRMWSQLGFDLKPFWLFLL